MLQALLQGLTTAPGDVQVWDCVPLVVVDLHEAVVYGQETQVEFTPFESSTTTVGHAISLKPNVNGLVPEISIDIRQYIDNPIELGRRQGIILVGVDQNGEAASWYINGAADRFLTSPDPEQLQYDEETAKLLEEELAEAEPSKLNLNSFL